MLLTELLPDNADPDSVFDAFSSWTIERGLTLYPAQEEAVMELVSGANVILATPTGSGKSMVAIGAHFYAMSLGKRTYYTAPIKALVSEKFFALCEVFGAENVGMMTGDAAVNSSAPIICATAEIVANLALREGPNSDIGQVVMDEFHFYSEPDRGWAWQVPLIELPHAQFLLMSATLGEVDFFSEDLTRRTGKPTTVVSGTERPVPLMFSYATTPVGETIEDLVTTNQSPVYIVHFTQAAALERAQALTSVNFCSKEEKEAIAEALGGFRFTTGFGKTLSRLVRHGIGVHHAGMLPKYRRLIEVLAQDGLLKVICGTDTLGVGINVPIRTVLLTGLAKYDGVRTRHLKAREFHQIAGRAGRAGYDTMGTVVVQAPEHEVENLRAVAKAGDDPKKIKKIQRKKAPEGFVSWSEATFDRLVAASPEPLVSRFSVSNSMLLNVIARPGNCFDAMRHLLEDNHESRPAQRKHILKAISLYRGLLSAGIVERLDEPDEYGRMARLTMDLQRDFALNQPLSPFALAAFELLDVESDSYALDVVSIIESTLDDPRQVLMAQQHFARGEAVAQMKADGIEYEERMELLEEVTWPKPLSDLLFPAFEMYRGGHPWITEFALSPKSVVRDMIERAMTFAELISHYGLTRSEGLVLRYLADAYRALRQTVPTEARTEELEDIIEWLGELIRQVDSSLLDEWESLTDPGAEADTEEVAFGADIPRPISANPRAFRVMVRNAMFRRIDLASRRQWNELENLEDGIDAAEWEEQLLPYFEEYATIGTGPSARGPALFQVTEEGEFWRVRQVLEDPEGDHGWALLTV
ncbi:MAG: DUF3516 domain-containing protein, partial [Rhodococcus sp.]|nr:DUF3516 domain-containing protein [Rhodococcus sp. (in: high G+C Gram-positive bacteria)]